MDNKDRLDGKLVTTPPATSIPAVYHIVHQSYFWWDWGQVQIKDSSLKGKVILPKMTPVYKTDTSFPVWSSTNI